jgi:hypothetical protein
MARRAPGVGAWRVDTHFRQQLHAIRWSHLPAPLYPDTGQSLCRFGLGYGGMGNSLPVSLLQLLRPNSRAPTGRPDPESDACRRHCSGHSGVTACAVWDSGSCQSTTRSAHRRHFTFERPAGSRTRAGWEWEASQRPLRAGAGAASAEPASAHLHSAAILARLWHTE